MVEMGLNKLLSGQGYLVLDRGLEFSDKATPLGSLQLPVTPVQRSLILSSLSICTYVVHIILPRQIHKSINKNTTLKQERISLHNQISTYRPQSHFWEVVAFKLTAKPGCFHNISLSNSFLHKAKILNLLGQTFRALCLKCQAMTDSPSAPMGFHC